MLYRKTNSGAAGVWLLVVCHLLIVLPLAYYLNIWSDEGSSLYSTESIGFAFRDAASIERQAPLYFWILSLWRAVNGSIFFSRLLSIICSVGAIWLFSILATRVLKSPRAATLATGFVALHPILIWASVEIRVYALVILLSIILLRLFVDAFFEESSAKLQRNAKIFFLLTSIVSLYTNYYLGFLLVGLFVALIATAKWRAALNYLGTMAVAGIAFAPLALTIKAQFAVNTADLTGRPPLIDAVHQVWGHVLTFVLPADIRPGYEATTVGIVRLWIVRAAIAMTAIVGGVRWRRISAQTAALAAVSATVAGGLIAACLLVGSPLVSLRHASVLFAPLTIFLASVVADVFGSEDQNSEGFKYAATLAGVVVLGFFAYALTGLYPTASKNGDWTRVAAFIQQKEKPGQPIVVFHTYDALAMRYEYHGVNRVLPDERYFDFDFDLPTPERIKARTEFTISKIPSDASEIWVIANDECKTPGTCEEFEQFLNANYDVVDQHPFYRNNVTLLRKRHAYQ